MQPRRERVIPARRVRIAEKWSAFKKCLPTFLGGAFGVGGHAAAWAIFVPAIRSAGLQLFAAERIARLSFKPADFIEENGECRPMRRERGFVSSCSTRVQAFVENAAPIRSHTTCLTASLFLHGRTRYLRAAKDRTQVGFSPTQPTPQLARPHALC